MPGTTTKSNFYCASNRSKHLINSLLYFTLKERSYIPSLILIYISFIFDKNTNLIYIKKTHVGQLFSEFALRTSLGICFNKDRCKFGLLVYWQKIFMKERFAPWLLNYLTIGLAVDDYCKNTFLSWQKKKFFLGQQTWVLGWLLFL